MAEGYGAVRAGSTFVFFFFFFSLGASEWGLNQYSTRVKGKREACIKHAKKKKRLAKRYFGGFGNAGKETGGAMGRGGYSNLVVVVVEY